MDEEEQESCIVSSDEAPRQCVWNLNTRRIDGKRIETIDRIGEWTSSESDFIHQSLSLDNDNFWYIITHYCIYITGITKLNEIRFD